MKNFDAALPNLTSLLLLKQTGGPFGRAHEPLLCSPAGFFAQEEAVLGRLNSHCADSQAGIGEASGAPGATSATLCWLGWGKPRRWKLNFKSVGSRDC